MGQQHPQFLTAQRLDMHRTVKPDPHHLRDAARIVAVRLVDLRLEHRLHVPRLNTDHRQARFGKRAVKPLRQRPGFQSNALEVVGGVLQHRQQRLRFARYLHFPNDLARVIHNADARLLDRYVQSSKMVHAALLLLMLEAVNADLVFTISLKRSTQNLPLSTNSPADYPIYWVKSGHRNLRASCSLLTHNGPRTIPLCGPSLNHYHPSRGKVVMRRRDFIRLLVARRQHGRSRRTSFQNGAETAFGLRWRLIMSRIATVNGLKR